MGFFSFVKRVGNKIAGGVHEVARVGKKVTGTISNIGHKIAHHGKNILDVVDRIPVIGTTLSPVTGVARGALGIVSNVADAAGVAENLLTRGDNLVQTGNRMLQGKEKADVSGLVKSATSIGTDTRNLGKSLGGDVRQARELMRKQNPNNP